MDDDDDDDYYYYCNCYYCNYCWLERSIITYITGCKVVNKGIFLSSKHQQFINLPKKYYLPKKIVCIWGN